MPLYPSFLLFLGAVLAADTTPPAWPDGAWLQVGKDQALYDHPATTEAELLRRQHEVQLSLYWPAARDDGGVVAYHIFYDQQERARVAGDTLVWGARVQDGTENWAVVPVDAAGNHGPRLEGRLDRLVPYVQGDDSQLMIGFLRTGSPPPGDGTVSSISAGAPELIAALDAAPAPVSPPLADTCTAALDRVRRYHDGGNVPMSTISTEACVQAFSEDVGASDLQALACLAAADSDEAWLACWQPGESRFDDRRAAAGRVVGTLRGVAGHGPNRGSEQQD